MVKYPRQARDHELDRNKEPRIKRRITRFLETDNMNTPGTNETDAQWSKVITELTGLAATLATKHSPAKRQQALLIARAIVIAIKATETEEKLEILHAQLSEYLLKAEAIDSRAEAISQQLKDLGIITK